MWILLSLFLVFSGCTDRPSRAKFPGPPGRTTDLSRAENTQAVLGGVDPNADASVSDGKSIRGIVRLKEGFSLPQKDYVIFLSARPVGGGPPLAVRRMRPQKFPFRYALTEANTMMGGTEFSGLVEVTLRIDQLEEGGNSDPLSRLPGDLFGKVRGQVGNQDLEIIIDQKI